ncbi:MAG: SgcJ/EcaC family oxidoreductase [Nitrospira sp.]|jgi:uncharacterized protein (TIGR02246 family)|nr:SgcJ/EcaC family oxidoreductase [Nitrospira sp.]HQY59294.1 SgcJ/EcaC family oxidoreductase [Nitrospira sp.]HRA95410.1 SgcJ/EcaC family oxidoreductase [Nitrospira sp.]
MERLDAAGGFDKILARQGTIALEPAARPSRLQPNGALNQIRSMFCSAMAALLLGLVGAFAPSSTWADSAPPDKAVAASIAAFVNVWNAHDATALGRLFTDDGDFVGIAGTWWRGPAEIAKVHAELFAGRYDKSVYTADESPSIIFLKPDVALVHWRWTISGVRSADGDLLPPYRGIFTWLLVSRDGAWRLRAAQNNVSK